MRRCGRCLLPDTYPGLQIREDGQCNICDSYNERWGKHDFAASEAELREILARATRRKKGKYDCLVPLSGGKDSSYVLHLCRRVYGLEVLAMNFNNGFQAPLAKQNIETAVAAVNTDYVACEVPWEVQKRLYRAFVDQRADICIPCEVGFMSASYKVAAQEKIPLIVMGSSARTEGIAPMKMAYYDGRLFRDVIGDRFEREEVADLMNLDMMRMARLAFLDGIRMIQLPLYVEWNEHEIKAVLERELGWREPQAGEAHFDCLINRARGYFRFRRWGFGKTTLKVGALLRSGQIEPDEALRQIRQEAEAPMPAESVDLLVGRLGLMAEDIAPYFSGEWYDYTHFRTYRDLLVKLRWLVQLGSRLHVVPENFANKLAT